MPASATYGRLMPRGAGFCHVFCGAFIVRFTALSPSFQTSNVPLVIRSSRKADHRPVPGTSRHGKLPVAANARVTAGFAGGAPAR